MDSFDRRILDLVQQNNRITSGEISDIIGLSPAAVQRRLKNLREEEVIIGDVSIVSPKAIGRTMSFIVDVSVERERIDLMDAFKRQIRNAPEVQQCYYVTGDVDFVLVVTAKDMDDFEDFTQRFFFNNPNIRTFRTSVVMKAVKVGLSVPIPE